jgi:hypothetical protein
MTAVAGVTRAPAAARVAVANMSLADAKAAAAFTRSRLSVSRSRNYHTRRKISPMAPKILHASSALADGQFGRSVSRQGV